MLEDGSKGMVILPVVGIIGWKLKRDGMLRLERCWWLLTIPD
jgi:hypothetical protein